jgi:hypothetical protein
MSGWEPEQLRDFRARFQRNPALADAVLARPDVFPPAPLELERVLIRTDAVSVNPAIMRALEFAVEGIEAKLHLEEM